MHLHAGAYIFTSGKTVVIIPASQDKQQLALHWNTGTVACLRLQVGIEMTKVVTMILNVCNSILFIVGMVLVQDQGVLKSIRKNNRYEW